MGNRLFEAMIASDTAVEIGVSSYEDTFSGIPNPDKKRQMHIPELLDEAEVLRGMEPLMNTTAEYPFALVAGARRAYTANCAIRDP